MIVTSCYGLFQGLLSSFIHLSLLSVIYCHMLGCYFLDFFLHMSLLMDMFQNYFFILFVVQGLFGVRQFGVDINGYVKHPELGVSAWLQRRSKTKPTWPGKLDNMVSCYL